jgi:large subunit ribosomal protein L28
MRFAVRRGRPVPWTGCPAIEERLVASVCDVCGKGPGFGMSVSHSHRRTRRRWNPNIQTVRALVGGGRKRLNVCTSCLKAGKVTR